MIGVLLKNYIYKRSKELNRDIPDNIESTLFRYKILGLKQGYKIIFTFLKDGDLKSKTATAIVPKCIIFNAEWAATLVLNNNSNVENAFLLTLGHELAHKDGDFSLFYWNHTDRKFINWVTEVHHDFAAAQKMVDSSRDKLLDAITYKIKAKKGNSSVTTNSHSHPSWETRKIFVLNHNFDDKLIKKIAHMVYYNATFESEESEDDVKYININLCDDIEKYYKPIKLI